MIVTGRMQEAMMSKLVIYGAGAMARLAHYYFTHDSPYDVVAFAVDPQYHTVETFCGLPLVSSEVLTKQYPPDTCELFVAIGYAGMNKGRAATYAQTKAWGYQFVRYVSSHSSWLTDHPVGENCIVLEQCTVQPFARIGNNVIIWSGAQICHDAVVEDHCFIAANAAVLGYACIGPYSFIGANATVRDHIKVADETLVGAGATITHDTVAQGVYLPERTLQIPRRSSDMRI
jgi:sugar O-acyltransferase (sialic acid O-acetyltransferase NeuD family)